MGRIGLKRVAKLLSHAVPVVGLVAMGMTVVAPSAGAASAYQTWNLGGMTLTGSSVEIPLACNAKGQCTGSIDWHCASNCIAESGTIAASARFTGTTVSVKVTWVANPDTCPSRAGLAEGTATTTGTGGNMETPTAFPYAWYATGNFTTTGNCGVTGGFVLQLISGGKLGQPLPPSESATPGFHIPTTLPLATRGKPYKPVSFCETRVPIGKICGFRFSPTGKTLNPKAPTYTFRLRSGSASLGQQFVLLPFGMRFDFVSGTLYGTPSARDKPGQYHFVICAEKLLEDIEGSPECRDTTLTVR